MKKKIAAITGAIALAAASLMWWNKPQIPPKHKWPACQGISDIPATKVSDRDWQATTNLRPTNAPCYLDVWVQSQQNGVTVNDKVVNRIYITP